MYFYENIKKRLKLIWNLRQLGWGNLNVKMFREYPSQWIYRSSTNIEVRRYVTWMLFWQPSLLNSRERSVHCLFTEWIFPCMYLIVSHFNFNFKFSIKHLSRSGSSDGRNTNTSSNFCTKKKLSNILCNIIIPLYVSKSTFKLPFYYYFILNR